MRVVSDGTKSITINTKNYKYTCDNCGIDIGEFTINENDPMPPEPGVFQNSFFIEGTRYEISKHLCDDCAKQMNNNIRNALVSVGFEEV